MKEILIFSDDISNYGKYRSFLETGNTTVSLRGSIEEAVAHINHKQVDLVVIDFDLPEFTNDNLWIINPFESRDIPVILVVEHITNDCLEECLDKLDCEVVLKQNINEESFLAIVSTILNLDESTDDINYECASDTPFCDTDNVEDL